jgi:hypothetical protein
MLPYVSDLQHFTGSKPTALVKSILQSIQAAAFDSCVAPHVLPFLLFDVQCMRACPKDGSHGAAPVLGQLAARYYRVQGHAAEPPTHAVCRTARVRHLQTVSQQYTVIVV